MTWEKVTGYELEWQVRSEKGRVTMLFDEGEPVPRSLPAHDFSVIADMLRHELPRVWYEDAQEILKASDKKPGRPTFRDSIGGERPRLIAGGSSGR